MADEPQWGSDEWQAATLQGPTADAARERLAMDPETRRAEYEARKADAETKRIADLAEFQREATKTEETRLKTVQKEIEREEVKQGARTKLPPQADPNSIKLKVVRMSDVTEKEEKPYFLFEPYLIQNSVIGFYGRGGTGKSSFLATIAAILSDWASTLWISTEETESNILNRFMKGIGTEQNGFVTYSCRGNDATLQVFQTIVTRKDKDGHAIESMFNVYEHLEPAIIAAKDNVERSSHDKPVKLVVLDTIVALTTWDRQAGPNSDEGVKKLMTYLRMVAAKHEVTIAVVGHSNKGKHDHFADSVMGAAAWTTSPRLSFIHGKDRVTEGQIIVRWAKGNEVQEFAQLFRLHMVHELAKIADGPEAGLMKVSPLKRVWGGVDAGELWDDVTAPPKEDDEGGFKDRRKLTVAEIVRNKLVEMVHAGKDPQIIRAQVECQLPDVKVNRAQWAKVDMDLRQLPMVHKVEVTTGPQNMAIYKPISDDVQK